MKEVMSEGRMRRNKRENEEGDSINTVRRMPSWAATELQEAHNISLLFGLSSMFLLHNFLELILIPLVNSIWSNT